ncbi:MAG: hypothetical protein PHQ98_04410 [Candidatus ainarchaeum sp.]|nr:hypothetical protein [Candidatus ainarchaeum sp.]
MRAENFIFNAHFFVYSPDIDLIRNSLQEYLQINGFIKTNSSFNFNFLCLEFSISDLYLTQFSKSGSILAKFGLVKESEIQQKNYFKLLKYKRIEAPINLKLIIHGGKYNEKSGLIVEVISECAAYYQISQLNLFQNISEDQYSFIVVENKKFIHGICGAVGGKFILMPQPMELILQTNFIQELKKFGFLKVADLLIEGKIKIEKGNSDGLDDLRGAIDNFLFEIVTYLKDAPDQLNKASSNLKKICAAGYFDENQKILIEKALISSAHTFLSNTTIHSRNDVDLITSRFLFDEVEKCFELILNKVVKYKMKVKTC